MMKRLLGSPPVLQQITPAGFALVLGMTIGSAVVPAAAAQSVDPQADEILRRMSTYLGGLSTFSVDADVDNEVIELTGRKLQYSSSETLVIRRPDKLHLDRHGPFAESRMFFDGRTLTLSLEDSGHYAQLEAPGDIDTAIKELRSETGLDAPAGDLFFTDPYTGLVTDLVSGTYNGTAFVQGVECHHLAFRAERIDWQIWIQAGDTPLPMKYIITSKWITAAPQFSIRFRNWNTNPQIDTDSFTFVPAAGATRIESLPVNSVGELMTKGDQ